MREAAAVPGARDGRRFDCLSPLLCPPGRLPQSPWGSSPRGVGRIVSVPVDRPLPDPPLWSPRAAFFFGRRRRRTGCLFRSQQRGYQHCSSSAQNAPSRKIRRERVPSDPAQIGPRNGRTPRVSVMPIWKPAAAGSSRPRRGRLEGIPTRAPLADLLRRQRALTYVGRTESWVFRNRAGGPLDYHNWRHRGWQRVLERSKVSPREGDAQKALRRSYITSALVCGRNPKLVAAELGHATSHMVAALHRSSIRGPG
jgi:hypothetical protein